MRKRLMSLLRKTTSFIPWKSRSRQTLTEGKSKSFPSLTKRPQKEVVAELFACVKRSSRLMTKTASFPAICCSRYIHLIHRKLMAAFKAKYSFKYCVSSFKKPFLPPFANVYKDKRRLLFEDYTIET